MYLTSNIRGEVMYWRKANAIHGWFERNCVTHVEDVLENLKIYPISLSKLEDLVADCIRVKDSLIAGGTHLKETVVTRGFENGELFEVSEPVSLYRNTDLAKELLPPTPGFFFGGYEFDKWYLKDIEDTIKNLTLIIKSRQKGERFYYQAWW